MALRQTHTTVMRSVRKRNDQSRSEALTEIKNLRKDLIALEKVLKDKKPTLEYPLYDVVHGALEVFRHSSAIFENEKLMVEMENELNTAKDAEYLIEAGASLLKKPEGWHWISPKGEMHYLGTSDETSEAAQKLKELRSPIKKKKAPAKKAAPKKAEAKADPKP